MKLLIPFILVCFSSFGQLFLIEENGLYGYINERGEVVIPPTFKEATDFENKYAWARIDGKFGCIDNLGKFVLKPQYDVVFPFQNGVAKAIKNNESFLINAKYSEIVELKYNLLQRINDDLVLVGEAFDEDVSEKRNFGIFYLKENRIIRTFSCVNVYDFSEGYAVVYNIKNHDRDYGVIDSVGRIAVDFGIYDQIYSFNQKVAVVSLIIKNKYFDGLINRAGKLIFMKEEKKDGYLNEVFSDGYGILTLNSKDKFIDLKGNLFDVNSSSRLNYFQNQRTVIKNKKHQILTTSFELIGEFDEVLNERFKGGYAIVKQNNLWGIIDVDANYVVQPTYEKIDQIGILNGYFFYQNTGSEKFGLADFNGKITETIFDDFSPKGFRNGLLKVIIDDEFAYVNKQGIVVWKEKKNANSITKTNIVYMNRGYFYASPIRGELGGFGGNSTEVITDIESKFPDGFSLIVETDKLELLYEKYAYNVYIVNRTDKTISFPAQDRRLDMRVQAKDSLGNWKDIEYLPNSWCGNSYHSLTLDPEKYWSFKTPVYEGEFKTKLRIKLVYNNGKKSVIYSNEYEGSVNQGQFWNKIRSHSTNIMDPY